MSNIGTYKGVLSRFVLESIYPNHSNLNDKISRMMASGDLIQMKRGMYISGDRASQGNISKHHIANVLYGPSYVSFYSALSLHAMIPERVTIIESATIKKSKEFDTPLGIYVYQKMPIKTFHIGLQTREFDGLNYLVASPTKAVVDVIWNDKSLRIYGAKAMFKFLHTSLRIEIESIAELEESIINECAIKGKAERKLKYLLGAIKIAKEQC